MEIITVVHVVNGNGGGDTVPLTVLWIGASATFLNLLPVGCNCCSVCMENRGQVTVIHLFPYTSTQNCTDWVSFL